MRAVFFDLDGTLVELPADFEGLFETALADEGVTPDPDYYECYLDALLEHLDECHPEPYRAAMADLCAEFDLVADFEPLAEAYVEREGAATEVAAGVREVLDRIAGTGDSLGVLTNGAGHVQRRKLEHHDLAGYFDAVVVSGDAGASKPDPEMFEAARAAIPADEYVFVADDLERDVLPAREAGFAGIHLADEDADGREADGTDATVSSLREVPAVLD